MTRICSAPPRSAPRRARGATLIIGMLLLLLTSVVALTSLKAIKTDERLAGNLQDRYLAFQAAEAALREGELLLSQPALPAFGAAQGMYRFVDHNAPLLASDFTTSNAREYPRALGPVAQRPRYTVEQMEGGVEQGDSLVVGTRYGTARRASYRITAVGYGASETTLVQLQETYRR
jgi:type IV pilus assembly protein PilX